LKAQRLCVSLNSRRESNKEEERRMFPNTVPKCLRAATGCTRTPDWRRGERAKERERERREREARQRLLHSPSPPTGYEPLDLSRHTPAHPAPEECTRPLNPEPFHKTNHEACCAATGAACRGRETLTRHQLHFQTPFRAIDCGGTSSSSSSSLLLLQVLDGP